MPERVSLNLPTVDIVHRRLRQRLLNKRGELIDAANEHAVAERTAKEFALRTEAIGLTRALVLLDELYLEIEKEAAND